MKYKAVMIVQVVVVLGLGAAWIAVEHRFDEERRTGAVELTVLSNTVSSSLSQLNELRAVNLVLETNLVASKTEYSNDLAASEARRAAAAADLVKVEAEARSNDETAAAELTRLDKQIADLEAHHQDLDTQSANMQNAITNVEVQIKDTKWKLAGSTDDRELLMRELKQLQAKKAALERDFNDLDAMREQLRKVKAEIAAARNYDWVRRGVYASFHQKAGERMIRPVTVLAPNTNGAWNFELKQDGSVTVTAPDSTNAPPPQ
jgi:chromosome segregation ATPase